MPTYLKIGTTDECLADFMSRYEVSPVFEQIASFCGVTRATVAKWFNGTGAIGGGHVTIGLRCFLDVTGYKVQELDNLDVIRRQLAFLIAFQVVTPEDVRAEIGYANLTNLWSVLYGNTKVVGDKLKAANKLITEHAARISQVEHDRWRLYIEDRVLRPATTKITISPATTDTNSIGLYALATLLGMQIDLTNQFVVACLAADLDPQLHATTRGGAVLLELADNLTSLAGRIAKE